MNKVYAVCGRFKNRWCVVKTFMPIESAKEFLKSAKDGIYESFLIKELEGCEMEYQKLKKIDFTCPNCGCKSYYQYFQVTGQLMVTFYSCDDEPNVYCDEAQLEYENDQDEIYTCDACDEEVYIAKEAIKESEE